MDFAHNDKHTMNDTRNMMVKIQRKTTKKNPLKQFF